MKYLKIWEKLGKQPIRVTQNQEATVFIDSKEYFITGIKYESGRMLGFKAVPIGCKTCEYRQKEVPHTCDMCDQIGEQGYFMWSYKKH